MPSRRSPPPEPPGTTELSPERCAPECFPARELRLPARASELHRARSYADQAATAFGFDESSRFEFVFAANEAVTNAILHGAPDDAGTIGLRITATPDQLTLTVFDFGRFVTRVETEDPTSERGRGLGLIATLMDDFEVTCEPQGTIVRLGKRRRAAGPSRQRRV